MKKHILLLVCLFSLPVLAGDKLMLQMGVDLMFKQDYKEALYWFQKAADQGNIDAIYGAAMCHYYTEDYESAVTLLQQGADKAHPQSQFVLGMCHVLGQGVKQNNKKGLQWCLKAADQGLDEAQNFLGKAYYEGEIVKKDYKKAISWWTLSAEQGHNESLMSLASCYVNGYGVEQSDSTAFRYYLQAATNGHADAQYLVGVAYRSGVGVEPNLNEALAYYFKAAQQGHQFAQDAFDELFAQMATQSNPTASPTLYTDTINDATLTKSADSMPEFPGGQQAMVKFIGENIMYPVAAQDNKIQGRVVCQFVVDTDGSIINAFVARSGGDVSLDMEAIRVINLMPKWKPATLKGKPVRVKYTVPISFRLE